MWEKLKSFVSLVIGNEFFGALAVFNYKFFIYFRGMGD